MSGARSLPAPGGPPARLALPTLEGVPALQAQPGGVEPVRLVIRPLTWQAMVVEIRLFTLCYRWRTAMNAAAEKSLMSKIRDLSPQQVAEVEEFVEFLASRARKRTSLDKLLAIAPALEAAGVAPMNEEEIAIEVDAARAGRRARQSASVSKGRDADRS